MEIVRKNWTFSCSPGETLTLYAEVEDAKVTFRVYPEASAEWVGQMPLFVQSSSVCFTVPSCAMSRDRLNMIVKLLHRVRQADAP